MFGYIGTIVQCIVLVEQWISPLLGNKGGQREGK